MPSPDQIDFNRGVDSSQARFREGSLPGIDSWASVRGLSPARRVPQGACTISGDSRAASSFGTSGKDLRGIPDWLEQFSAGALTFTPSNAFALGGITIATYITTYLPSVIASTAPNSLVIVGANDSAQSVPLATSQAGIDTIVTAHKRVGKTLLLCNDYLPLAAVGWTSAQFANQAALSRYIDTKHDPANGIFVVNSRDAMAQLTSNYKSDNLHPSARGCASMALASWAAVKSYMGPISSLFARSGLVYNPNSFSGWTKPVSAGVAYTETVEGGIAVLRVDFTSAVYTTNLTISGAATVPAGVTVGTSIVDSIIGYEVTAGPSGLLRGLPGITLTTFLGSGVFVNASDTALGTINAADGNIGGSANTTPAPDYPYSGVLHTLPGLVAAGAGRVQQWVTIQGDAVVQGPIDATVKIYLPQLRAS